MTKYKLFTWSAWVVLVLAAALMTACGNDGPIAPPSDDVHGYSSGGDISKAALANLMARYDQLSALGGGTSIVPPDNGYTMICIIDRWKHTNISAHVSVAEDDGTSVAVQAYNGMAVLHDLKYPITVSAWVDGYVSETVVETSANLIVFGLKPLASLSKTFDLYGVGGGQLVDSLDVNGWKTDSFPTQSGGVATSIQGDGAHPYSRVSIDPDRPTGVATFLFADLGDGGISQGQFVPIGYTYQSLGIANWNHVAAWVLNFSAVEDWTQYALGTISYPAGEGIKEVTITAGYRTQVADEFVPLTMTYDPFSAESSKTLDGLSPGEITKQDGMIRAMVSYTQGGSETVFMIWTPASETVPDITFAHLPGIIGVPAVNNLTGMLQMTWTIPPVPAPPGPPDQNEGILVVQVTDGVEPIWILTLESTATQLAVKSVPQFYGIADKSEFSVTQFVCTGQVDAYDNTTVYTSASSIAESAPIGFNGSGGPGPGV